MTTLPSHIDVAVIGAGAAGLAAALRLRDAGASSVLIEARDRAGGRAQTIAAAGDVIDLGCEWLHSADRNCLVGVARNLGFTVDEGTANWGVHVGRHFSRDEQKEFHAASRAFWDALENAARTGGADLAASNFLPPGNRWNGLIQAISGYYNGVELESVSIVDLDRFEDTMVNWTIRQGYGAMIAGAAVGLPTAFDCAVRRIDHSRAQVRIETTRGTIEARAVIVTLPTNLVADGAIEFFPALPDKVDAAAHLPLGLADKIFFEVAGASDLPDGHLYGSTGQNAISFDLFPRGRRLVSGFVGGVFARELEQAGEGAFEDEARRQLKHMLGADALKPLRFLRATTWARDPFVRGAYSHALPGHADARAALATPVDGRLFFAGEACSRDRFSTAHGAWETGVQAAEDYLKGSGVPG